MSNTKIRCASIRSSDEPQYQCMMYARKGTKYCPIHSIQSNIVDYQEVTEIQTQRYVEDVGEISIIPNVKLVSKCEEIEDEYVSKLSSKTNYNKRNNINEIEEKYMENEDDLIVKLLILINDEEYTDIIPSLIGPVFNDITLSEDNQDPITFDDIWIIQDGKKIQAPDVNKYFMFSYIDSNNKTRCMTVFSIQLLLERAQESNESIVHPITMEPIPEPDIQRARKLVEIYSNKLGLFDTSDDNEHPEYKLQKKIDALFSKFHVHSIYFESSWLLDIRSVYKLRSIISTTKDFVTRNIKEINPNLSSHTIFNTGFTENKPKIIEQEQAFYCRMHEYIIDGWTELISITSSSTNQLPIWIIATVLSKYVPEIKIKYPFLETMF